MKDFIKRKILLTHDAVFHDCNGDDYKINGIRSNNSHGHEKIKLFIGDHEFILTSDDHQDINELASAASNMLMELACNPCTLPVVPDQNKSVMLSGSGLPEYEVSRLMEKNKDAIVNATREVFRTQGIASLLNPLDKFPAPATTNDNIVIIINAPTYVYITNNINVLSWLRFFGCNTWVHNEVNIDPIKKGMLKFYSDDHVKKLPQPADAVIDYQAAKLAIVNK